MRYFIIVAFFFYAIINLNAQIKLPEKLSLKEAESIAMENNPEIKKAFHSINSAKGKFWQGISPQQPELNFSYDFVPLGTGLKNFDERTIEINQSFEFPLLTYYKGKQFDNGISLSEIEYNETTLSVLKEVRADFISLEEKMMLIKIKEENLNVAKDFKEKSAIRFNVGEANNIEKLTADVQYTQALNELEVSKNNFKVSLNELLYSMGIKNYNYSYLPEITDSLVYRPFTISLESLIELTSNNNYALKIAETKKLSSELSKKVAISSYLPGFSIGYKRQAMSNINDFYGINFGITIPLWFLFDQKGKIQEAEAEIKISENEFEGKHIEIMAEVKKTCLNIQNSEKQIQLYRQTLLPQAEEIYRTANASYNAGEISYLELLQAKQTLIAAKENYIYALKEYNLNLIELEKLIGKKLF